MSLFYAEVVSRKSCGICLFCQTIECAKQSGIAGLQRMAGQRVTQLVLLVFIFWIVIYLAPVLLKVDSAIHRTNHNTLQRCMIQVFKFGDPLDPFLKDLGVHCKILGVQLINIQELIFDLLSLNCCYSTLSDF